MQPSWAELPYPVLRKILGMLSIVDAINMVNACLSWKRGVIASIKSVRIDESLPCAGSWKAYNKSVRDLHRTIARSLVSDSIDEFARSLAELTGNIEHLYFCSQRIPASAFRVLLSSQKAIKTLEVKLPQERFYTEMSPETRRDIRLALTDGIIRHEASLETIKVGVTKGCGLYPGAVVFPDFKDLVEGIGNKPRYFPNLKSVEFLSPSLCTPEKLNYAEIFFQRLFHQNKIRKINISLQFDFASEITRLLEKFLKSGSFSNLREINVDILLDLNSDINADLFIKNCPNITHIESYSLESREDDLVKIIKNYGAQLVHLRCQTNDIIAQHIAQYCCNLKSLGITGQSRSCFAGLVKLEQLEMSCLRPDSLAMLGKVVRRLKKLKIGKVSDPEVMQIIRSNAKNLISLEIEAKPTTWDNYASLIEEFSRFLERKHCLEKLHFVVYHEYCCDSSTVMDKQDVGDKITELLIEKHSELRKLTLGLGKFMSEANRATLIKCMPFCKIAFNSCPF